MNDGLDLMEPEPTEPMIKLDIIFGHIKLDSRMRPDGNRLIGEGRALHFDRDGVCVKDTGWQPNGLVAYWPDEPEAKALREGIAILRDGFFRNLRRARDVALKFKALDILKS